MKWFRPAVESVKIITVIVPFIESMMKAVEGPGHGADKKKAVMDAVDKLLTKLSVPTWIQPVVTEFAGWLIDVIAMIRHLTGTWEHTPASTAGTTTTKTTSTPTPNTGGGK